MKKVCKLIRISKDSEKGVLESIHLYILSDEALPYDSAIFKNGAFFHIDALGDKYIITKDTFHPNPNFCKRIIASTNRTLGVPGLSKDFISDYCKVQGKGYDEVNVEYIEHFTFKYPDSKPGTHEYNENLSLGFKPKISIDETIEVSAIEQKTYTKDEVIQLFHQLKLYDGGEMQSMAESIHNGIFNQHIDQFIIEHL